MWTFKSMIEKYNYLKNRYKGNAVEAVDACVNDGIECCSPLSSCPQ